MQEHAHAMSVHRGKLMYACSTGQGGTACICMHVRMCLCCELCTYRVHAYSIRVLTHACYACAAVRATRWQCSSEGVLGSECSTLLQQNVPGSSGEGSERATPEPFHFAELDSTGCMCSIDHCLQASRILTGYGSIRARRDSGHEQFKSEGRSTQSGQLRILEDHDGM